MKSLFIFKYIFLVTKFLGELGYKNYSKYISYFIIGILMLFDCNLLPIITVKILKFVDHYKKATRVQYYYLPIKG